MMKNSIPTDKIAMPMFYLVVVVGLDVVVVAVCMVLGVVVIAVCVRVMAAEYPLRSEYV